MAFPNGVVPTTVPVHPTALYETLVAFLIAGILWALQPRWAPGAVFGGYLALSGAARLLVEFLRINDPVLLGLTGAQLFSAASITVGIGLILTCQPSAERRPSSEAPSDTGTPLASGAGDRHP